MLKHHQHIQRFQQLLTYNVKQSSSFCYYLKIPILTSWHCTFSFEGITSQPVRGHFFPEHGSNPGQMIILAGQMSLVGNKRNQTWILWVILCAFTIEQQMLICYSNKKSNQKAIVYLDYFQWCRTTSDWILEKSICWELLVQNFNKWIPFPMTKQHQ